MTSLLPLSSIRRAPQPLLAVLSTLFALGCGVEGSGHLVEERYEVKQYDSISLGDGFTGEVRYGEEFSVVIETDDNLIDDVRVLVDSGRVRVDLDDLHTRRATLRATFTLPSLTAVAVSDGGILASNGVPLADSFSLDLSGGSIGRISPMSSDRLSSLLIESSGGSSFDLVADADSTLIDVSGGGTGDIRGRTSSLVLSLSGGSVIEAPAFKAEHLSFNLSGGSSADVFVTNEAKGRLSGGSSLAVAGGAHVTAEKSGGSAVTTD